MKNKIKRLAKGDFHIKQPEVQFPETKILMRVGEGEIYQGSFSFQNQGEETIRGLVYPSSYRVHCNEQGFDGNPVNIYFTYDGTGLVPGHVEHGKFTIVCNGGEYEIAFTAIIEKPFVMTAHGKVQSLDDFKKLAFKDFAEAEKLFRSRDFYEILKYEDKRIRVLYDNMRKWELDSQALEEFLVGCKQKEKIFLMLEEESRAFMSVEETRKETLTITKNTWGYQSFDVRTVGDFLDVEHTRVTTDEFIGNSYRLEYLIEPSALHKGSNFGLIVMESPYETLTYEVVVEKDVVRDEDYRMTDLELASITKEYLSYEAGLVDLQTWADHAVAKLKMLREKDEDKEMYRLLQAHILILQGKKEDARWILESYNYNRFAIGKNLELSSYYLFLTTQLSNDSVGQKKVAEELSKTYMKHPESWKVLCMLVNVDQEYRILSERLRVLEQQFYRGAHSILFYMEAFKCYREKSSTLKHLGEFEIQVLLFAAKHKLLTKELALYTANLASQTKQFNKHLYQVLVYAYKMYDESMILSAICTLLIKGNCVHSRYFMWYEKAVESELKIAQLYEYYMESVEPDHFRKPLPRSVYLYFMHGNMLDFQKKAFLYSNLITYEDETSEIYSHYRDEMEAFAWNQLDRRNVDDRLRIIYKRFVVESSLNTERVKALYDICHAYLITTKLNNMKYCLLYTSIHSGDSISVYPAQSLSQKVKDMIEDYTKKLAQSLHVIGLINIQFIVCGEEVYVIEVNPRSSRTVPYISKVTGIPIVPLATRVIIGNKIKDLGYTPGLQKEADYIAIKMPVFSFEKIRGADISLGPEMKSTGECLGIAKTFNEALYKAFLGAGINLPKYKNMIMTVRDEDKEEAVEIGRRFSALGYRIFATKGTADALKAGGVKANEVKKIEQESPNLLDLILGHRIDLVIDTPPQGADRSRDGFLIRRNAIETGVNVLTAMDTARALVTSLENTDIRKLTLVDIAKVE